MVIGVRHEMFEPLMRPLVQEAERREGSSGLGRYIARQIGVAHGGRIQIESSEREGMTFIVRLPRQPQSGLQPRLLDAPRRRRPRRSVLIATSRSG